MKKGRSGFLNRKPKFAKRITNVNGKRVWKSTLDSKEFSTKKEYFANYPIEFEKSDPEKKE